MQHLSGLALGPEPGLTDKRTERNFPESSSNQLTPEVELSSASRKKTYSCPGSRGLFSHMLWRWSLPTVKLEGSCLKQAVM